jgi:hypothetical protein
MGPVHFQNTCSQYKKMVCYLNKPFLVIFNNFPVSFLTSIPSDSYVYNYIMLYPYQILNMLNKEVQLNFEMFRNDQDPPDHQ